MNTYSLRHLIAAVLIAGVAPSVMAQWMWIDQNKVRHASDRPPPPDVPEKDILQRPRNLPPPKAAAAAPAQPASAAASSAAASAPGDNVADAKARTDPALEAKRRAAEQEKKAAADAEQQRTNAARAENCSRAKNYLQTLESGIRIQRTSPQGEREFLDDAQRAQEAQRAKDAVARDCR
jgi:type IV secretory pathway VirB10-like protein